MACFLFPCGQSSGTNHFCSTTASIDSNWHKFEIPPTKVDYVLSFNPALDDNPSVKSAVESLCRTRDGPANHTSFAPLRSNPLSVSIETKRYGGDVRRADVQIATWQAAQWTFLKSLAGEAISELPFLPGIVVQGHEWRLVATTRKNDETILWSSYQFGSTLTTVGVFQILAGVQRLRKWSVEVFWPWYRRSVLRLMELPSR